LSLPRIGVSSRTLAGVTSGSGSERKLRTAIEDSVNKSIVAAGGLPLGLPVLTELGARERQRFAAEITDSLDGLVLQGGTDIEPSRFGQNALRPEWSGDPVRDAIEFDLVSAFIKADKPILGLCRGFQVLNVALGGSLFQDLPSQRPSSVIHNDSALYDRLYHEVTLQGSLAEIHGSVRGLVTSAHHQGIDRLAAGLSVEALAGDGLIEGFRMQSARFVVGVQWHPEFHDAVGGMPAEEARPVLLSGIALVRAMIAMTAPRI
jgi:putative glutamine amidotransferase